MPVILWWSKHIWQHCRKDREQNQSPCCEFTAAQTPIPVKSLPSKMLQLSHHNQCQRGLHTQRSLVALKFRRANLVFIRLGLSLSILLFSIYLSAACIFKHHQLEKWSTMRMLFPRWLGINTTAAFDPWYKQLDNTSTRQLWVWLHSQKQSKKILLNPAKLALLLQKTRIVHMPILLLPAAPERLLGDSGKLSFSLWNTLLSLK